eukprot:gene1402-2004_t
MLAQQGMHMQRTHGINHANINSLVKKGKGVKPARAQQRPSVLCEAKGGDHSEKDIEGSQKHGASWLAAGALSLALAVQPAAALDSAKLQLAGCIADEKCLENLVCLNKCNGRPDEADCQIRCGDLYSDKAIAAFNSCAVSQKNCVPQKADTDEYPIPPRENLVKEFNPEFFDGRWYIASGYNKLFDTFDCQVHYFTSPAPGEMYAKLNWRVKKANGQFYERNDIQTFVQNKDNPALLENHDNEFLHYQDDWYIVDAKEDNYAFVYYRGSNDAWDGYGGAVIYSKTPVLDPAVEPELRAAAERVGLNYDDFEATDNTCGPEPPLKVVVPTDLDVLADDIIALEKEAINEVVAVEEEVLVSFSRGFTVLQSEIVKDEQIIEKDILDIERKLLEVEKQYESKLPSWLSSLFEKILGGAK